MPNEDDKREQGDEKDKDRDEPRLRQRLEALIPDLVKKSFYTGLGAVFATQEKIGEITGDITLPKEVANYLYNTAQNTKDEFFKIVARETREFLERVNLQEELAKLLTTLSLEVKTEIRFIPNDESVGGVKPDVKRKVALKRVKEDGSMEDIESDGDKATSDKS
jgi:hypothetical protein